MAVQSPKALSRAITAGDLAPVYYFYGSEEGLKDEAVSRLVNAALDPGVRDFNYDQRSAGDLDPEGLHALLNTLPMMAERRVVILRDLDQLKRKIKLRKMLERYLKQPAEGTMLVLVDPADGKTDDEPKADAVLARSAQTVHFKPLDTDDAIRWVTREALRGGVTLKADAAGHLVLVTGSDTLSLRAELGKILALGADAGVTVEQVGALIGVHQGETPYDWRDAVMGDKTAAALGMIDNVLAQSGVSGVRLVMMLGTSLIGTGLARREARGGRGDSRAVIRMLQRIKPAGIGKWGDEAANWVRWAPHWPAPRVRSGLRAALDADMAIKSTRITNEAGVITDLVLALEQSRREAAA